MSCFYGKIIAENSTSKLRINDNELNHNSKYRKVKERHKTITLNLYPSRTEMLLNLTHIRATSINGLHFRFNLHCSHGIANYGSACT